MRIEDKLRDIPVRSSEHHKDMLKNRLLVHMETTTMKPNKRFNWLVLSAGSLAVIALVIGATIWQPSQNTTPNIAQKAIEPLTVRQVFAKAREASQKITLKDGQLYYQKLRVEGSYGNCQLYTEFEETYTNSNMVKTKDVRTNQDGKMIESSTYNSDGSFLSHDFDQVAFGGPASYAEDMCPKTPFATDAEEAAYTKHLEAIATAYKYQPTSDQKPLEAGGGLYLSDLRSGNLKLQADTFKKLEGINEWKVTQNVTNNLFKSKVIELSYTSGPRIFEKIYFDQQTKTFVGMSFLDTMSGPLPWTYVVVDVGVR